MGWKNDINASYCHDYKHILKNEISYNKDEIYTRNYNYADYKYENVDEINHIELNSDYLIENS